MSIQTEIQIKLGAHSEIRDEINVRIRMIDHEIEALQRATERIAAMQVRRQVLVATLKEHEATIAALTPADPIKLEEAVAPADTAVAP